MWRRRGRCLPGCRHACVFLQVRALHRPCLHIIDPHCKHDVLVVWARSSRALRRSRRRHPRDLRAGQPRASAIFCRDDQGVEHNERPLHGLLYLRHYVHGETATATPRTDTARAMRHGGVAMTHTEAWSRSARDGSERGTIACERREASVRARAILYLFCRCSERTLIFCKLASLHEKVCELRPSLAAA